MTECALKPSLFSFFLLLSNVHGLTEQNDNVRLNAIKALTALYEDDENITPLDVFTNRFKRRIIACTLDKEISVALAAIELATRLAKYGCS